MQVILGIQRLRTRLSFSCWQNSALIQLSGNTALTVLKRQLPHNKRYVSCTIFGNFSSFLGIVSENLCEEPSQALHCYITLIQKRAINRLSLLYIMLLLVGECVLMEGVPSSKHCEDHWKNSVGKTRES